MLYGLFNLKADKRALDAMSGHENLGLAMADMASRRIKMMVADPAFSGVQEQKLSIRATHVATFLGMFRNDETVDFEVPPRSVLMHVRSKSLANLVDYSGLEISELIKTYKFLGAPQRDEGDTGYVFTPILHNTTGPIAMRMTGNSISFPDGGEMDAVFSPVQSVIQPRFI